MSQQGVGQSEAGGYYPYNTQVSVCVCGCVGVCVCERERVCVCVCVERVLKRKRHTGG